MCRMIEAFVCIIQAMEEQEEYHLDEDALTVLSLFPTRDSLLATPTLPEYSALATTLTCGLCREILFTPVYLRCSHRFCKDCIERYLRNQRRVCPTCRTLFPVNSDPTPDSSLEAFIAAAFGDARRLSKRLREVDQDGLELRRAESQTDLNKNRQRENAEQAVASLTSLKRAKTADGEETRPKKRAPSEKKIRTAVAVGGGGGESERENTPSRRSKLAAELREIKKENVDPPPERKKRRSVMVIEIDSSQPAEVQEIPREEFQVEESIAPLPRMHPSISIIPEVSEMDSTRKILSMRDLQQPEQEVEVQGEGEEQVQELPVADDRMEVQEEVEVEMEEEPNPVVPPEVMAAREALHQQFGANFLSKILELADFPIFMKVAIARHPQHPFTPETTFTHLKILARTAANYIGCTIADDLNVNRESVRLFVCEGPGAFIEVASSTKLQEINSRFWRTVGGFEIGEVGEYAAMVEADGARFEEKYGSAWQNRVLYYFIDYSKIVS